MRGTALIHSEKKAFLFTAGFVPRLNTYPGDVMVRRLREPLTPQQSRELTQFAEAQVGKRFAVWRTALQGTPFCPRSGWRRDQVAGFPVQRR